MPGFWDNISNQLFGTAPGIQQVNNYTPEQQQAFSQLLQGGLQGLQNPTAGFQPIANQVTKQFETQTVPSIAERFTSLGGGQRSSAFQGALGQAGADLGGQLGALQAQYGLQNRQQLLSQVGMGLQPQFSQYQTPGSSGLLGQGIQALGNWAGGNIPGLAGQAFSGIKSLFGGGQQSQAQPGFGRISPQQISQMIGANPQQRQQFQNVLGGY